MDQLKQSFAAAAKYGFWIGTGTITLGALVIWFMVTGALVEENNSRTSKIKSDVSAVSTLRSELSEHPNQISKAAMDLLVEGRQAEVLQVWQEVYDAQRDILVWPEEELTTEFVDEFRDLMPTQHWVKQRFDELEKARHFVAHNRMLSDGEFARIEMYVGDWNRTIGL